MVRLVITGVCGRMGGAILKLASLDTEFRITHVIEAANHPLVGKRLDVQGRPGLSFPVEDDMESAIDDADVVVDFTETNSSLRNFRLAATKRKAIVIGTTGFSSEALAEMRNTAQARAVISPNMSIGVNLLFNLVERAARVLGTDYDAEIVELHHKWKKDAPSGTAVRLRDVIENADPGRNWTEVTGRNGMTGERKFDEIGVFAVRGGDTVGEHTVFFAGIGERVEITHRAYSRDNFARGALAAAKWIVKQERGIFDMNDVLGLNQRV
ncbi:MAG: 4-hydroxy-tetrahydrodipicolinate reductase [Syntrophorhabdaceae bacterium PtaU1.Bin034]|nr:MAG: 4-hydroxy-tetrahydrodipicolinate reductase [Syntrophorhabdaceae bacterium PtaU1.Bin034]